MSVKVKGFDKLLNGSGRKMIVKKEEGEYLIDFKGGNKQVFFIDYSTPCKNDSEDIKDLVNIFLDKMNIEKVGLKTNPLNKKVYLYAKGNKKLYVEVGSEKLDVVYKVILEKYLKDRKEFLDTNDVDLYGISLSGDKSSYSVDYQGLRDSINLTLLRDEDGKLLDFEKKFISKFVFDRLASSGKKAEIVSDCEYYNIVVKQKCLEYFICCGDVNIVFDNDEEFKFLFDVVNRYNKKRVNASKKRVKKVGM